jgi:hypothetical protein
MISPSAQEGRTTVREARSVGKPCRGGLGHRQPISALKEFQSRCRDVDNQRDSSAVKRILGRGS